MSPENPELHKARIEGNTKKLSAMGKKGVSHKMQLEDLRTALNKEDEAKRVAEEAKLFSISQDGDILPPEDLEREI